MDQITSLEPTEVWYYFNEICKIPRPSKHEEQIINYLLNFGKQHQLKTDKDKVGNVVISKPAHKNSTVTKPLVLQSHVDMVGEKNSDVNHDFKTDAILPYINDDWVKARGTTLGADDGIGIAAQLALLASTTISHGSIECLFTIDEETGLTGAKALKPEFFNAKTLLNLDSEDEGELFIGCAGGVDSTAQFNIATETTPTNVFAFSFLVAGLTGGHSGDDIHKELGNANKLLNQFLVKISEITELRLSSITGGNLRNAIAREASATGVIPYAKKEMLRVEFNVWAHDIEQQFKDSDPDLTLKLQSTDIPETVLKKGLQNSLLSAISKCQHGVIKMSSTIEGLVQTSTNLASVKMIEDKIIIVASHRSSLLEEKDQMALEFQKLFEDAGAIVQMSDGYPGWEPNMNSSILKKSVAVYESLFGVSPKVKAIHAGLECGLFLDKYPGLDMISFGPTIKGAHSPDERLHIDSVRKFWNFLIAIVSTAD